MEHPSIEQLDFVIDKLKSVLPQASKEGAFNMSVIDVYKNGKDYEEYPCGTIHCTGGWYAVANLGRKVIKSRYDSGVIDFRDGGNLMARDLGFKNMGKLLADWAKENPDIWGNTQGRWLFVVSNAYSNPGFAGVVKQFEIVKSNLIKLEG